MKRILYILPLTALMFFSCDKEDPGNNEEEEETPDTTSNGPKIYQAQVILTVLDGTSNPYDSVACIMPYHEPYSAYTAYYTDSNGVLTNTVWYKEEYGGMPDSQFVSLSKGPITDTIYIPLGGDNSTNYFTHTLD